jgi:hypothetical protein
MKRSKISNKPFLDILSQQRRRRRKAHQSLRLSQAKQMSNINKILRKLSPDICQIIKFLQFNKLQSRRFKKKRPLKSQVHIKVHKALQIQDQLNKKSLLKRLKLLSKSPLMDYKVKLLQSKLKQNKVLLLKEWLAKSKDLLKSVEIKKERK